MFFMFQRNFIYICPAHFKLKTMKTKSIDYSIYLRVLLILGVISFSSCSWVYRSNTVFMPAFEQKGDFLAEASSGSSEMSFNAGYAITDRIALTASFQNRSNEEYPIGNNFAEVGIARFSRRRDNSLQEIMGGVGYGSYKSHDVFRPLFLDSYEQMISTSYLRSHIQYNRHFKFNALTFSLGSRLSYVHFSEFEDLSISLKDQRMLTHYKGNNISHFYLEPVGAVSYDFRYIGFFIQTGYMFLLHGTLDYFVYDPFVLNSGIRLKLNRAAVTKP
jgi:hypothetical protein